MDSAEQIMSADAPGSECVLLKRQHAVSALQTLLNWTLSMQSFCIQGNGDAGIEQSPEPRCIQFRRAADPHVRREFYKSISIIYEDSSVPEVPLSFGVYYYVLHIATIACCG